MRNMKFFVPGPLPGMNEIIDAAKSFVDIPIKTKSAIAKSLKNHPRRPYRRLYQYTEFKSQWNDRIAGIIGRRIYEPFDRIFSTFIWVEPDRKRDPDNIAAARKFIFDGMVKARLIKNDGWKNIAGWIDIFKTHKETGTPVGVEVIVHDVGDQFDDFNDIESIIKHDRIMGWI